MIQVLHRSKIGACEYRFLFAYATRCIEGLPPNKQKKSEPLICLQKQHHLKQFGNFSHVACVVS